MTLLAGSTWAGKISADDRLQGLGEQFKRLGRAIPTVGELLDLVPRKHIVPAQMLSGADAYQALAADLPVMLVARVETVNTRRMRSRRGQMATIGLRDTAGETFTATFFNAYPAARDLRPGNTYLFAGKLSEYRGRIQLSHPEYVELSAEDSGTNLRSRETATGESILQMSRGAVGRVIPVYPGVKAVGSLHIWYAVQEVLRLIGEISDPLPQHIRHHRHLLSRQQAIYGMHAPRTQEETEAAKERCRYDEAFAMQCALLQRRYEHAQQQAHACPAIPDGLQTAFKKNLPFTLTAGQEEVAAEISADLSGEKPMNRLLQGEVGSGKTVIALSAMLQAVDSGYQAVLLAPTEVLAAQHYSSITSLLGPLGKDPLHGFRTGSTPRTQVTLLTGSLNTSQKRRVLTDIVSGHAGIVIGTHAVLSEQVQFHSLGLVVVDEQHRFGVQQRAALQEKSLRVPHTLVMTATPIPRTIGMTVFGDLDISTLRELPSGRAEITTHVLPAHNESWMARTWERIAEEASAGHGVFVVTSRIGLDDEPPPPIANQQVSTSEGWRETNTADAETATELPAYEPVGVYQMQEKLLAQAALKNISIAVLHGRMPAAEKDACMEDFRNGKISVLVSTTVIEVGVDIPQATMMVVMDADRFGIASLHQLRGRIGRGGLPGLCLLHTVMPPETPAYKRLQEVASTTDGFALADVDLTYRQEGDILGTTQSGSHRRLRWLSLVAPAHREVIKQARQDAQKLIAADPRLGDYPHLVDMVSTLIGSYATFLERN